MKGQIPGFKFDARRQRAKFEVILPGTGATRRKRKTVNARTRDEALAKWKSWRDEVLGEKPSTVPTMQEYFDTVWPKSWSRLAEKTVAQEKWILQSILLPRFGTRELRAIKAPDARDLIGELLREGYAPPTINGAIRVLRKILHDASDRELIPVVPVWRKLRVKEGVLRLEMSDDERRRFLAAFDDDARFRRALTAERKRGVLVESAYFGKPRRFGGGRRVDGDAVGYEFERFRAAKLVFIAALETGLDQADLLSLPWACIDLDAGVIRASRRKTGIQAEIPVSKSCREALVRCKGRALIGATVFLTEHGHPYSVSTINRYFRKAKSIAGITRRLRFKDLRHTFASRLASKGVSLQIIAKALGHKSAAMSERYARPNMESIRVVREALESDSEDRPQNTRELGSEL